MWKSISDSKDGVLYRGDRLKIELSPHNAAEDQTVDFMLFDNFSGERGLSLIRLTGYSAGNLGVTLPSESSQEGHNGISIKWLKANWKKWMPVDGKPLRLWIGNRLPRARPKSP